MTSWIMLPSYLPLVVGLPLVAAVGCILFRSPRWCTGLSLVCASTQVVIVILLLLSMQGIETPYRYTLAGWGAPLGIDLELNGLALILLLLTSFLVLILSLYSNWYFSDSGKAERFWPLWWLLIAGLNAAFIAADAFNIYVALEMIGLAAVALVALAGTPAALSAALRYTLVGLLGSLCYLLGIALLYRAYGTLDLTQLAEMAQAEPIAWAALSLISVGLLLKTALLPLHFWLPPAHANAPAPVSAILSALVVKATFYLLIRFWLEVLDPAVTELAANLLGVLGAAAIVWGCLAAYRAERLKLLVAYSTVAQLGYLFLLFPLALANDTLTLSSATALAAITYFIVAHALAKAAMFLAVGNILVSYNHDKIDQLQDLARQQPLPLLTFAIAGISLVGLPPSGGFIAKWLLLNEAVDNGQWWWVIVMLAGGLLAAAYIGRVLSVAFNQVTTHSKDNTRPLPNHLTGMALCGLVLALAAVALGFNAEWILSLLDSSGSTNSQIMGIHNEY